MALGWYEKIISTASPWYTVGPYGKSYVDAVGWTLNASMLHLKEGLNASKPLKCNEDALPWIAGQRMLRVYDSEPLASKRDRLAHHLQLHRGRGSHQGEMRHVQPYFLGEDGLGVVPRMRIVHQSGHAPSAAIATWHTLDPDGSYAVFQKGNPIGNGVANWNFDGAHAQWSRFWAIVYTTGTVLDTIVRYDDGSEYDDPGVVYDAPALTQVASDLVAMILDWKAAHSTLWGVILATDPDSFDPTAAPVTSSEGWTTLPNGNWGSPIDGDGNFTRLPTALWIYDLGQG
jgi:hypothetical protein